MPFVAELARAPTRPPADLSTPKLIAAARQGCSAAMCGWMSAAWRTLVGVSTTWRMLADAGVPRPAAGREASNAAQVTGQLLRRITTGMWEVDASATP